MPQVELTEDQHAVYVEMRKNTLAMVAGEGGGGGRVVLYSVVLDKHLDEYEKRVQSMKILSETSTRTLVELVASSLSKPEQAHVFKTWMRLMSSDRDMEAQELFWNAGLADAFVSEYCGPLVSRLAGWAEYDDWGVEDGK